MWTYTTQTYTIDRQTDRVYVLMYVSMYVCTVFTNVCM